MAGSKADPIVRDSVVIHPPQLAAGHSTPDLRLVHVRELPASKIQTSDMCILVILAATSVLYLWQFRDVFEWDPDEGILLQGAIRVLRGELPYRDFFSFYTPGSYYWNALLFKLFGESLLVPRTVMVVYGILFSGFTFLLARRLGTSRKTSTLITLLLLVCCLPIRFIVLHNWDSTAAAIIALYSASVLLRCSSHRAAAITGVFAAFTVLFNQARGVGLAAGLLAGFLLISWRMKLPVLKKEHVMSMAAAFAIPLIITIAFFAAHNGLLPMLNSLMWAARHYSGANHLPYGYIIMSPSDFENLFHNGPLLERGMNYFIISAIVLLCAMPIFVVLAAAACAVAPRKDLNREEQALAILAGAVVAGSLATALMSRPDFHHLTFLAPLFFFLMPWMFNKWGRPFSSLQRLKDLVLVYALLAFAAYGLTVVIPARRCTLPIETRRGTLRIAQPNQLVPFVQQRFPAGSRLLIYPYFPLYSFLTATINPGPYEYLQPGMHSRNQFEALKELLASSRPEHILLEHQFTEKIPTAWPNTPLSAMLSDPVTDYIVHNYKTCRILDARSLAPFLFMVRKDLPCDD